MIKEKIRHIIKHPLFTGSLIMIIGSNAVNLLNYMYHFIVGRMLGPIGYGELASLISLMGLIGVIPASFSLVIIKYTSSAKNEKEVGALLKWLRNMSLIFAVTVFVLLVLISYNLSQFLQINNQVLVIMVGLLFLCSVPLTINRSVLQGLLKFKETVISSLVENLLKLILSIILIYIGFSVFGALMGFILANVIGWALTAYFIGTYDFSQNFKYIKGFLIYSIPVIIQSFAITSLYSIDLILVKHFFTSYEAGLYASLSTLGRIIFFGAGPIAAVMFPMVAKRFSDGQGYRNIMIYSVVLTLGLCCGVLFVYWLFPEFAIGLLYGQSYVSASNLLIYMGIFMTLFTLSSLLISYYLSVGKTKIVILPLIAAVAQFVGIWLYHHTLFNVIIISNIVSSLLLLSLLIYFAYERSKINISHSPSL